MPVVSSSNCYSKMSEAEKESKMEVADETSLVTEVDDDSASGNESSAPPSGLSVQTSEECEMASTSENVPDDKASDTIHDVEVNTESPVKVKESASEKSEIGCSELTSIERNDVGDKTHKGIHEDETIVEPSPKDVESNTDKKEEAGETALTSTDESKNDEEKSESPFNDMESVSDKSETVESDSITTDKTVNKKLDAACDDEGRQPEPLIKDSNVATTEKQSDVTSNSSDVNSSITMCRVASEQTAEPEKLKGISAHSTYSN